MVSVSKGVERDALLRMSEVILDVLLDHRADRVAVLTGPNLAREVAEGQPAATMMACLDPGTAAQLRNVHDQELPRVHESRHRRL